MNIKRIIAAVLSSMLLVSAVPSFAMTEKEAVDRVTSFGWVEEGYEASNNVTRADFAKMLVKFGGIAPSGNTASSYDDIANGDEALPYINAAVERGFLTPYLNNKFDPDGTVTKQQTAKALLTLLGYSSWAESQGGYPAGYTTIALGTAMFDGVAGEMTKVLTYSDIIRVLANSATIPICEPVVKKGVVTYEKNDSKTILTEVYDASSVKGRIIANNITSITDEYAAAGSVKIVTKDGVTLQLEDGGTYARDYIGYSATIYYREVNGADTIAYIVPDSRTTELTFATEDIDQYSNGTYTYYVDGKRKTARVSKDADIIYNGKRVDDISGFKDVSYMYYPRNDAGIVKDGTVRLVSTEGSSTYDIVFIEAMDCYAVDHYSEANDMIYLKNNQPSLNVEDENLFDLYDTDGNQLELTSLAKWDIIEVYRSIDGSYSKYVIVRDKVEGTVDSIRKDTTEHGSIRIDGVTYPYDDNGTISIGTTGVFLLSSKGRVIMMTDEITHSVNFGYIVKAYSEDYDDIFYVKMLTMDGEIVEYESAEKVKYDGASISAKTLKTQVNAKMLDRRFVVYDLSDGKINKIDTEKQNSTVTPDDLRMIYSNNPSINANLPNYEKNTGLMYKKNLNCLGGRIIVDSNTKIVIVPDANSSFDNYSIRDISYLRGDGTYKNMTGYTLGTTDQKAKVVVMEIEGGVDNVFADESNIAIVAKIGEGVNPRGEEAQYARVYVNGVIQEIYGEDSTTLGKWEGDKFYPLSVGDIIRYNIDESGVISSWKQISGGWKGSIDPIYVQKYEELSMPASFEDNIYGSDRRFACKVYDRIDNYIGVAVKSRLDQVKHENGDVVYFSADNTNVYIYDKSKKDNKVTVGTVDDLETYQSVGNECSYIFLSAFKGEAKDIVIFK